MRTRPFRDGDTFATFRNITERVVAEIEALDNDHVLNASPTELEEYYISRVFANAFDTRRGESLHRESGRYSNRR